jgi:hypothetical protein
MMNWKSTAAVSGVGLLLTWLANEPARNVPAQARAAARPAAVRGAVDIQEQAERLRSRMPAATADYSSPSRNLFRFREKPAPVLPVAAPIVVAPVAPLPPTVTFSGIASDTIDGREQRTAILKTSSGLVFVHEGEDVAGQFRVGSISEDAVELIRVDGSVLRLR